MKTKPIPQTSNPVDQHQQSQDAQEGQQNEWKEKYLRALADYQNLLRRSENEQRETEKYAGVKTVSALLGIFDLFEKAQAHLKDTGLDLALKQLNQVLHTQGVERIMADGEIFNPEYMECVEADDGQTVVTETVSPGYKMNGKLIRPAKVRVLKRTN